MPRAPLSLSSCSDRRASVSGSHYELLAGVTSSPGMSSRNTEGRESGNEQETDGEGEHQEVEGGDVVTNSRQNTSLNIGHSNRIELTVQGTEFEPACAMAKIREIIHCHFKGPWIYFSEVPTSDRRVWFLEFKKRFWWDESIQESIVAIWKMRVGEHLRTVFYKKWAESEKFQHYSEINKQNRASESPHDSATFNGGARSVISHIKSFRKDNNNREPTMEELLNITYKKKNGEWSGTRPTITLAKFNELLAKAKEESEEIDIVKLWVKAAGGVKRGRVFGFGSGLSDVPRELIEKYSFAKVHKPDLLQSHGEFHTFREDTKQQVSILKIEVSSLNEQLNTVKNLVQNMALQLQPYPSFQGYPIQFQFPTMQAQFRCNPTWLNRIFFSSVVCMNSYL